MVISDYRSALVVCRRESIRECLSQALWSLGFAVDGSHAEIDAIRLCQNREYDLVAISNEMPVMSAWTLLWIMKILNPMAKYVVVAEAPDRQAEPHVALLGVTHWWLPPFDQETVAGGIRELGLDSESSINAVAETRLAASLHGR